MDKKPDLKIVRPFYTIAQIATLIHMSRRGARNFLLRCGLRIEFTGNRYIIYLSDIRDQKPELFASIMESVHLNELIEAKEDLADREYPTKHQFQEFSDDWS